MIILIIIVLIILLIVFFNYQKKNSISEKDMQAIQEALNYIEVVKNLFEGDSILKKGETLGCFQIIPIDESKEMYTRNSCRLIMMLMLYDEDDWRIQLVNTAAERNSSAFSACFQIEMIADCNQYVAYTVCRFTSNYQSFMKNLYIEVNKHYPNKFKFDGSRIMSCDQYGISIF